MKKYLAEMFGTMVLVLMGCGVAVSLGCSNEVPSTVIGTALAFGLSVVAMAYTIGGVSGCHINPAIGSTLLYLLTSNAGLTGTGANDLQDANVTVLGGLLAEIIFTCVFVLIVLGATAKENGATNKFAGLAIGLGLVLIHLACIRYTGTSVNPARSIAPALFAGGSALEHLWIFIVGPFIGACCAAGIWKVIETKN